MTQNQDNQKQPASLPGQDTRSNGLLPEAPEPGQTILVAGGAGYIGSCWCRACSTAATRCASSTACTGASSRWPTCCDQVELVVADVREMPATALDGVDAVINLSGLSNDPTAEYDPEANWQMNAIATETLGAGLRRARHRALRLRLLLLALRRPAARHARRDRADRAARRLRDLEALRRGEAARAGRRRPLPGDPAQRHGLRLQPADALRPGRQHVRQGRAAQRQALPARRRLDVAPAGRRAGLRGRDDRRAGGARGPGPRRDLQRPALQLPDPRAGDAGCRLGAAARPRGRARPSRRRRS